MEYIIVLIYILTLIAVICFFVFTQKIVKMLQEEKKDLLNRLMAKNYNEYAVFEHAKEKKQERKEPLIQEQDVFPVN